MQIRYHPSARLTELEARPDLLAVVCYGEKPAWRGACPCLSLPLAAHPPGLCEIMIGGPAAYGEAGSVRYAHDGEWLFAAITIAEEGIFQDLVADSYDRILETIDRLGYPCLIRTWQHFPDIHKIDVGLERYRQFNCGRHRALVPYLAAGGLRPAATCVGSKGAGLTIYALARQRPGIPIENPRQIAAYRYPASYGPQPPDFVRAMKVEDAEGWSLWISGTAAIVGHESRAPGDLAAQMRETVANLDAVVAQAGCGPKVQVVATKVYLRAETTARLSGMWQEAPALYLRGDICRSELAVEIEALVRWPRHGQGGR